MKKIKKKTISPIMKKAKRGFRGYPVGTIALYGPDETRASKLVVGVIPSEDAEPSDIRKWHSDDTDLRKDMRVHSEVSDYLRQSEVRTVTAVDRIIGCPHEEGVDYPTGETCPMCPYWAGRDRWTGKMES